MREGASLRRTQELFWRLITAPEGIGAGLKELTHSGSIGPEKLDLLFSGGSGDEATGPSAADRLDIYANMYFYRLLDTLKEDYPSVRAAVGDDRFHNLVTDYLLQYPSSHPSLRYLGEHLQRFLSRYALGREYPYLADLARLEWDRVEMFDAADATPVSREDLARLPQDRAGQARFTLVPACRVRRFDHDVAALCGLISSMLVFFERVRSMKEG